jgi:hypothetical protein
MFLAITLFAAVYLLGAFVVSLEIAKAPEAYEDEDGFHFIELPLAGDCEGESQPLASAGRAGCAGLRG